MRKRYQRSRSTSNHRSRRRRSTSRSRERKSNRDHQDFNFLNIKKEESDIKNHFTFKIKPLGDKEQIETLNVIKKKLTECVGPVQHIARTRERGERYTTLKLGFKYDIDAISYLSGGLTIKTSSQNIQLNPTPTEVFSMLMNKKLSKSSFQKPQKSQKKKHKKHRKDSQSRGRNSQSSYSESPRRKRSDSRRRGSSGSMKRQRKESISKNKKDEMKLHLFGVPTYANEFKIFSMINKLPGGPYHCEGARWKKIPDSCCEYFQFYLNFQKGKNLLRYAEKLQIEERPVLLMESSYEKYQFLKYQVKINFPKPVHPYTLLKNIKVPVVQILGAEETQSDGRCRSFLLTISDSQQVYNLKRVGRLQSGITTEEPRDMVLVYRPNSSYLLPTRSQLT